MAGLKLRAGGDGLRLAMTSAAAKMTSTAPACPRPPIRLTPLPPSTPRQLPCALLGRRRAHRVSARPPASVLGGPVAAG
eukprot:CAMPEP_0181102120 /NCGR_PEP_ID=MMETSP1071-20121207/14137_1 /TAXON_ID=35127 /ORGANISM="Thalassiosira sp., Strain NH16" /LENGTH=78 /DNA_ID=CAMNT_0023185055 /DNA_START=681 /DNA_END=917 /DNA_ORIENTATION=+